MGRVHWRCAVVGADTNDVVGRDTGRPVGQKAAHDLFPWSSGCHISYSGRRQCGWPIATSNDVCRHRDACRGSDARRTRAVRATPHHCSKERSHVGGIDRHRIFERRRDFRAITVCWGCALCGPDHSLFARGANRPNRRVPAALYPRARSGRIGRQRIKAHASPANAGWVSLRLETSDFARLIFTRCRDHHRLVLPGDITCACSRAVCRRRWRHWSARHSKFARCHRWRFLCTCACRF